MECSGFVSRVSPALMFPSAWLGGSEIPKTLPFVINLKNVLFICKLCFSLQPSFQVINKDIGQQETWLNTSAGVSLIISLSKKESQALVLSRPSAASGLCSVSPTSKAQFA